MYLVYFYIFTNIIKLQALFLNTPLENNKVLLRSLKKGDKNAFEAVYTYYNKRIFNFIFSITKSEYATEEILQNVFITIWNNKSKIDLSKSFNSFVYTIARNLTNNFLNEVACRNSLKKEFWKRIKDLKKYAENDVIFEEYSDIVENIISSLPKQKKAIYILSKQQGKSNSEIADLLGITEKTVKNHLWKTMQSIKEQLKPHIVSLILFS